MANEDAPTLQALREQLSRADRQLLEVVAERQRLVAEIGRVKQGARRPTRDFAREKEVMDGARRQAEALDLPPDLAEAMSRLLIRTSLTAQEQDRIAAEGRGDGRRALVIGGGGRMGAWMARFLRSQGFEVSVADPAGSEAFAVVDDWRDAVPDQDVIVVAAPLQVSAGLMEELAAIRPKGLVFDVGSLKTPLRPALKKLVDAGVRVTSIHPMFGPDTRLLSGRHVIFVDVGVPEATREAQELFESTMAEQVTMELDEHDRLIAYVLGLSHALNIAFAAALAESGEGARRLAEISSTTFDAQLAVASGVSQENPELYFEIQRLNDHGGEPLAALEAAVTQLRARVAEGDAAGFVAMMERGREYFSRYHRQRQGGTPPP